MRSTSDGYAIAERDLEQRGPGDFIAGGADIRQHGRLKLKLAQFTNARLIMDASAAAAGIIADDPLLEKNDFRHKSVAWSYLLNSLYVIGLRMSRKICKKLLKSL
jgi:RecG-like helicase